MVRLVVWFFLPVLCVHGVPKLIVLDMGAGMEPPVVYPYLETAVLANQMVLGNVVFILVGIHALSSVEANNKTQVTQCLFPSRQTAGAS